MISVLVVDRLRILSEALAQFLHERDEITVMGAVTHSAVALAMVQELEPDVLLVAMQLPGSGMVQSVVASSTKKKVVALGDCCEPSVSVLLDATLADVIGAIHAAARSVVIKTQPPDFRGEGLTDVPHLTDREQAVVRLVDQGLSNKEIARELNMAVFTVAAKTWHGYRKLWPRNERKRDSSVEGTTR